MSSVKGQSQYDSNRHLNYISTAAFGDNIFNYTVAQDMSTFVYVGVLRSLLSVGTASGAQGYNTIGGASPTAPAGRILRVNNKKIFPSANPCATITVSSGGTSGTSSSTAVTGLWSQMVGVIDILTGLSGFIDPNDSMFAIYNVDKAIDYSNDGGTPSDALHKGPSLYTAGNVTADLNIVTNNGAIGVDVAAGAPGTITSLNGITANNGNILALNGNITAGPSAANVVLTSITGTSTPATQAIPAITASETVTLTCSPSATSSVTITGPATPTVGAIVNLIITANTNFQTTITFNTHIVPTGTYVIAAAVGTRYYIITFISDGTNLNEYSRSGALSVLPTSINVTGNLVASLSVDAVAGSFGLGGILSQGNITTANNVGVFTGNLIANSGTGPGTGSQLVIGNTTAGSASNGSHNFDIAGLGASNGNYAGAPAGYLSCYIGSTIIKIPYYNN